MSRCPLYPRKQTFGSATGTSAKCHSGHWSAIARTLVGHRESERTEKGNGKNRRKNIRRCYGHISNGLTGPNESHKERHDCERKANNHDDAEKRVHVRARYQLARHRSNPSGPLGYFANTASTRNIITCAVNVSKSGCPRQCYLQTPQQNYSWRLLVCRLVCHSGPAFNAPLTVFRCLAAIAAIKSL